MSWDGHEPPQRRRYSGSDKRAVYRGRDCFVDLYGGWQDTGRRDPWAENTMVLVFSTTKGLAAVAVAHAMSAGLFSADDLVADLWPQFGPAYPPISAHMRLQRFVDGPPEPDRSWVRPKNGRLDGSETNPVGASWVRGGCVEVVNRESAALPGFREAAVHGT